MQAADTNPRKHDPEAFDDDLEWLLVAGDASMGERGSLGGVIAQLEHGGPFTGVPNTDLYTDQQIGWTHTTIGSVEKHRWLSTAWSALPEDERRDLALCYHAPRAEHRSDEETGYHVGADAQLGRYAALAIHQTDDVKGLLEACLQPTKGKNGRIIARALRIARDRAVACHKTWAAAKAEAQKPRKQPERRALLAPHVPHLPESDAG